MNAIRIAQHRFYSATMLGDAPKSLNLAERTGLEPATPGVTGRYPNRHFLTDQSNTYRWRVALLKANSRFCNALMPKDSATSNSAGFGAPGLTR